MPRGNGGIIGPANIPSASSAKGVWSLMEQMIAKSQGLWPVTSYTIVQTFTATSTWTCPTGVTEVEYLIVAGGGGGGGSNSSGGGGGYAGGGGAGRRAADRGGRSQEGHGVAQEDARGDPEGHRGDQGEAAWDRQPGGEGAGEGGGEDSGAVKDRISNLEQGFQNDEVLNFRTSTFEFLVRDSIFK